MTDTDRKHRIESIVDAALRQSAAHRSAFVDAACGDDEALRAEVLRLVQARLDAPTYVPGADEESAECILPDSAQIDRARAGTAAPETIGPYRIVGQLGVGGMGVVYLAVHEQPGFRKFVAIKVVSHGADADYRREVLRRFELERHILSALDHPNIAKVFDAGSTEDGRPYFVMEYFKGLPIHEHCDHHRLPIDDRLRLFRQVCAAVQHAHSNLVVHRDLKPQNIIVTDEGVPKLLDFGIAKLVNPRMSLVANAPTLADLRVMTPEYASPEQVRGDHVGAASDIYSLGVLLFELLTGHRPYRFDRRIRAEMERVICEEEPARPSTAVLQTEILLNGGGRPEPRKVTPEEVGRTRGTRPEVLRRRLAGDLDNIVLKAMAKEPKRRYVTADRLAEDIEKHLNGLPVEARPNGLLYRSQKFARRNWRGLALTSCLAAALAAGAAALVVHSRAQARAADSAREIALARLAEAEARRGEREAAATRDAAVEQVRRFASVLTLDMDRVLQRLDDSLQTRRAVVEGATQTLESAIASIDSGEPTLRLALARARRAFAGFLASPRGPNIGDAEGAMRELDGVMEILDSLGASTSDDPELLEETASALRARADALRELGRSDEAVEAHRRSLAIRSRVAAALPDDAAAQRELATAINDFGATLVWTGEHEAALGEYLRSLAIVQSLLQRVPQDRNLRRDLAVAHNRIGSAYQRIGAFPRAEEHLRSSLAIRTQLLEEQGDSAETARSRRDLIVGQFALARCLRSIGPDRHAESLELLSTAHAAAEAFRRLAPTDSRRPQLEGVVLVELAGLTLEMGRLDESETAADALRALVDALPPAWRGNRDYRLLAADAHIRAAAIARGRSQLELARSEYDGARQILVSMLELAPRDAELLERLAQIEAALRELDAAS